MSQLIDHQFKFMHYTGLFFFFLVKLKLEVTSQLAVLHEGTLKDGLRAETVHKSHNLLHSLVSR